MKTTITLLIILFTKTCFSCTCGDLNKKNIQEFINAFDIVIIGTPIENVEFDVQLKEDNDRENAGINIRVNIEKVIKGNLDSESIIINQFNNGSCTRFFKFGDKYIFCGKLIKNFKNVNLEDSELMPIPRPPGVINGGILECYDREVEELEYWNSLAENENIINSHYCSAFNLKSDDGKLFLNHK